MKHCLHGSYLLLVFLLWFVPELSAQTLASWDFTGEPGNQSSTSGNGSDGIIPLPFSRGTGLNATAAANSISTSGWSLTDPNDYISFGIAIPAERTVTLDNLMISTRSSNTGPGNLVLRSSLDGFSSNLTSWTQTETNFNNQMISLNSLGQLSGTIEFRIYLLDNVSANGGLVASTGTFRVGNYSESGVLRPVQLTGNIDQIEIQEPILLLNYNFEGTPGNQQATAPDVVAEGLLGIDFRRGAGINPAAAANSINSNGWDVGNDRHLSFGFVVAPGKLVDLTELRIGSRSSNTGPRDMALRYSGDNFTTDLATWTSANEFLNQVINLSSLRNLSGQIEFRIISKSNTAVNEGNIGSGGTFRITNFFPDNVGTGITGIVKDAEGVDVPTLQASPSTLSFGQLAQNQDVQKLTYTLSAQNLEGPVTIQATSPFLLSFEDQELQSSLVLSSSQLEAEVAIEVSVNTQNTGSFTGTISHQTAGTIPVNVQVTATVFDPFDISENFNTSCPTGLPEGWNAVSVSGGQVWGCTTFGRGSTSNTASSPHGLQINGFSGGAQNNEDWLITPAFDLRSFDFPLLSFWSRVAFSGPRLQLMVSEDYETGDPRLATWTTLSDRFANGDSWTPSGDINLSQFKSAAVRIGFVYTSSPETGAARWTLDDFSLSNSANPTAPFLTTSLGNVDYFHYGVVPVGSASALMFDFTFSLSDAVAPIMISAGPGFEFSLDGLTFSQELVLTPSEASPTRKVMVRFAPQVAGAFNGPIRFSSGDIQVQRGFLSGATIEKANTFDIVTWNIEWFGSTLPGQGPTNVDQQLQNVRTIFEDLQADVYALQEIIDLQKIEELVAALPDYGFVVSPATSAGGTFEEAQKLVFLYNKRTVEPLTTRVLLQGVQDSDLVGYPSSADRFWASGRLPFLMEAKVNINGSSQNINLINVHTRSNGGGESAANPRYAMRRYDVEVLKDSLDQYYPDVPFILLGDYNDDLDETVADAFAPTVNTTETSFIKYINDSTRYQPVTLSLSKAGLRSFIAFENVIDHMIISDELADNWLVESERIVAPFNLVTNYQNTTSDHLPIKVRFTLDCKVEPGEILGNTAVCSGNEVSLFLIGGTFEQVVQWEVSIDAGETWTIIEGSTGKIRLDLNGIKHPSLFRALVTTGICEPVYTNLHAIEVTRLDTPQINFDRGRLRTVEGPYTYRWFRNGNLIPSSNRSAIPPQGPGNYTVEIVEQTGCTARSGNFRFPIAFEANLSYQIMPNPARDIVTVVIKQAEGMVNYELKTIFGRKIEGILTDQGFAQFEISSLARGVYIIVITDKRGRSQIGKVLVQ
jgi:endonuclease/exonuclease/phosphatase family metal-dependent hydrolase